MPAMSKEEELALLLLLLNHLLVVKSAGEENDGMLRAPLWVDKPTTTTNNSSSSLPFSLPFTFCASLSLSLSYVYVYVRAPAPSPSRSQVFFTYCHNTVPFSRLFHSFAVILGQHTFRTPRGFPAELGPIKKTLENTLSTLNTTQNTSHTFLGSLALR